MLYNILKSLALLISIAIFRIKISGRENMPKKGGFILASNHVSYLDPVVIGAACRRKLNYMARHDLFNKPLLSWLLPRICVFPVKRDSADFSALREAMRRIKSGGALLLFPEGTRKISLLDTAGDAEPGAGFLASKLNVPVVPVFIKGTEMALPRGAKFFKPASISVVFGKQIFIEKKMPYQDISRLIMENIRHLS